MSPRKQKLLRRLRLEQLESRLLLAADFDSSAPAILQLFESTYGNTEDRAGDIFLAGYGGVWIPPTGRADSGNQSVGYDVFDRFDLGSPGNPTLYGTATGLQTTVATLQQAGQSVYVDFVLNHNGFRDASTNSFVDAGGYPGFAITLDPANNGLGINDLDGDFHSASASGVLDGRLAGLIDIDQSKNYQLVRHPVDAENVSNIPGGSQFNLPAAENARFYPDRDLDPIMVFDPVTGESDIAIYPFNVNDPLAGDAIEENALGLLMRNAQWLVQTVGVDGFRLDAVKHFETYVLEYFDRAVYRSNLTPNLDGSTRHVFSFSEVFDGDKAFQQSKIRKDIDPGDPGRIGGNRDVLDFPLFFAMRDNLTNNGFNNDWRNIKNASQDVQDDGLANNGSQGVAFVSNHDEHGAFLDNVAHAYVLMRPGNATVYFNAEEFGLGRDFPKDGRGDALGGLYGDAITRLVNIRNSHGKGDYIDRTPIADEKEMLIFERSASSLTVLSNRLDAGFDSRTIQTDFLPGTPLIELTGNASDNTIDPLNDFPEVLTVAADGTVNLRVPRNVSPTGTQHNSGYFVYGAAGPQGTLALSNVAATIAAETPTNQTNGTARLTPIDVITSDSFQVQLDTIAVNHLESIRDQFADGDNALLKIDQGRDLNANGTIDFRSGDLAGFEEFVTKKQSGYFETDGNGQFIQSIDTTQLSEGTHFLDVRAFRHRAPGEGPPISSSFRKVFYVDRLKPETTVESFAPLTTGVNENRELRLRSQDQTADSVHVFLDLPAAVSDEEVLALLDGNSQTSAIDRDLFTKNFSGLTHGNHVATVVSFEPTGNVHVQRYPGLFTSTIFGAGLGDLNNDGFVDPADFSVFQTVLQSNNSQFNAAGDFDADGDHDLTDLSLFHQQLVTSSADSATLAAFDMLVQNTATLDFSDAPDPLNSTAGKYPTRLANDGARHILSVGPYLGTAVDADTNGQPNATSTGDDADGNDDEDGVIFPDFVVQGQTSILEVTASADAVLNAFFDANGDGDWSDEGEHFAVDLPVVAGSNSIPMQVPSTATVGTTVARFRLDTFGGLQPTGLASNGEVEDHSVQVLSQADFGDAPAPYPTRRADNGARHIANGVTLGTIRDQEPEGQPTANADGDGADEDGVLFGSLLTGKTTDIQVTVSGTNGFLDAWIDFNGDGDWLDAAEQIFTSEPVSSGLNSLSFEVPSNANEGLTFSRFRVSSTGGLSLLGEAANGEVEDYQHTIFTNQAPTLDPIPNQLILSLNAPEQTVMLSGITAGGTETQTLHVIASSSNELIVGAPAIDYTSPQSTATLRYTPNGGQAGQATLTVTVTDAGLDNDLDTTADNSSFQRQVIVNVSATPWTNARLVNGEPQIWDVDDNHEIELQDALLIINLVNRFPQYSTVGLPPAPADINMDGKPDPTPTQGIRPDVNSDGKAALADALAIVNRINQLLQQSAGEAEGEMQPALIPYSAVSTENQPFVANADLLPTDVASFQLDGPPREVATFPDKPKPNATNAAAIQRPELDGMPTGFSAPTLTQPSRVQAWPISVPKIHRWQAVDWILGELSAEALQHLLDQNESDDVTD